MKPFLKSKIFRKTMLSYTIVLSIPIVIFCTLMVKQVTGAQESHQREILTNKCKGTSDYIEEKFYELNNLGNLLLNSDWVHKSMSSSDEYDISDIYNSYFDPIRKNDISNQLLTYQSNLGVLNNIAVVFPNKETVVCPAGWYTTDEFLNSIKITDTNSKKSFIDLLSSWNGFKCVNTNESGLKGYDQNVLMIAQNLDLLDKPRAILLLLIDRQAFSKYIKKLNYDGLCTVSLKIGDETTLLYDAGDDGHAKILSTRVNSGLYQWKYDIAYRYDNISGINTFTLLFTALFISLLLGIIGSYYLAAISYKPVELLMKKIKSEHFRGDNEYQIIESSIDTLLQEKTDLQNEIGNYYNLVRYNLLLNLTYGYFDEKHIESLIHRYNLSFNDELHYDCILLCGWSDSFENAEDPDAKMLETILDIRAILNSENAPFELVKMLNSDISVIVYSPDKTVCMESSANIQKRAKIYFEEKHGESIEIFIGDLEQGIIGISRSYHIAKEKKDQYLFGLDDFSPDTANVSEYYYPTDWEIQLINHLKIGNLNTVNKILYEIEDENKKRNLPESSYSKLISLLLETMSRVTDELKVEIDFPKSSDADSRTGGKAATWQCLYQIATTICERADCTDEVQNDYGTKMIEYIDSHYQNPNASLKDLSRIFNLSVSAVSKIFKQAVGVNFYDYLCKVRMEKAKDILNSETTNIRKVGTRVGYENDYSFKRAFSRYEGIRIQEYIAKTKKGMNR